MLIIPVSSSQIKERQYSRDIKDSYGNLLYIRLSLANLKFIDLFEIDKDQNRLDGIDFITFDHPLLLLPVGIEENLEVQDTIVVKYSIKSHDCLLALKVFIEQFDIKNEQIEWIHPDLEKALLDELGNPDMPQLLRAE
jgi:hypothetical protein